MSENYYGLKVCHVCRFDMCMLCREFWIYWQTEVWHQAPMHGQTLITPATPWPLPVARAFSIWCRYISIMSFIQRSRWVYNNIPYQHKIGFGVLSLLVYWTSVNTFRCTARYPGVCIRNGSTPHQRWRRRRWGCVLWNARLWEHWWKQNAFSIAEEHVSGQMWLQVGNWRYQHASDIDKIHVSIYK